MTMVHPHTWVPGLLRVLVLRSTHVVTHIINGCFGVLAKKHPLVWVEHSWLLSVVERSTTNKAQVGYEDIMQHFPVPALA